MHRAEYSLWIISFVLLIVVASLVKMRATNSIIKKWYFGEDGKYYDKSRQPKYVATITGAAIVSFVTGYIATKSIFHSMGFTCINLIIISNAGLILARQLLEKERD